VHRQIWQPILLLYQLDLVSLSGIILRVLSDLFVILALVFALIMLLHGVDDGFAHLVIVVSNFIKIN
jgi:hypothetical protein